MKVYYGVGKEQLELRDEPLPTLGRRDVLVKTQVSAVSIGTEVWRYVNHGRQGGEGGRTGYNCAGQVVRVGADVSGLCEGNLVFAQHPHAQFFAVGEERTIKLPDDADLEAFAFTYLPTLGLHALRSADYQAGDNVLVVGLGVVGLLAALVARMVGARVAALEIESVRRDLARGLNIDPVLDPRDPATAPLLDNYFGAPGPDVVVDTSQDWGGLIDGVRFARSATRVAVVGINRHYPPSEVANEFFRLTVMNQDHFHDQRLKIIGCSNDPQQDYPPGVVRWTIQRNMAYIAEKIHRGELNTGSVITHRFAWNELEQVFRRFVAGDRSMVGVVLHWEEV